ncbi:MULTISPECIES: hypothetical protein [unclassified Bradyrhizobium]|uniref:hypothetical protein n=1 Tax=unclassified Bradyrhizobium TaxID=2631580 RepID=UPI002478D9EA|nr:MULTISPECIES: hypothetical protein [unclassified Bradyrhizobium]WGR67823.1 hypothetical protein MTX24_20355 [Bradyrhizobium sp. ISRA426]WGR79876.1 hypothetical protein MTX21_05470 [Bradyrhizobium sp. ISRA430]WGR83062.1 hypothetical protein MTX25_20035 [Bradyrhizobium sp. ISRA432]
MEPALAELVPNCDEFARRWLSGPKGLQVMDWVLGTIAVFCFAAGLNTIALLFGVAALITNVGIIGLRWRARAQGTLLDDGWVAPKLVTAIVLLSAVWCLAAQAGFIGS